MSRIAPQAKEAVEIEARKRFSPVLRMSVLRLQLGHCHRCGKVLAVPVNSVCPTASIPWAVLERFEVDHRVPLALGGKNDTFNLEAMCVPCHSDKTSRDIQRIAKASRLRKKNNANAEPLAKPKRSWPKRPFPKKKAQP